MTQLSQIADSRATRERPDPEIAADAAVLAADGNAGAAKSAPPKPYFPISPRQLLRHPRAKGIKG
jgi:hypothetical protein